MSKSLTNSTKELYLDSAIQIKVSGELETTLVELVIFLFLLEIIKPISKSLDWSLSLNFAFPLTKIPILLELSSLSNE